MKFFRSWPRLCAQGGSTRASLRGRVRPNSRVSAKVAPESIVPLKPSNKDYVGLFSPKRSKYLSEGEDSDGEGECEVLGIDNCDHFGVFGSCKGENGKFGSVIFDAAVANYATPFKSEMQGEFGDDGEEAPGSCGSGCLRLKAAIRKLLRLRWVQKKCRRGDGFGKLKANPESLAFLRSKVLSRSCEKIAENDSLLRLQGDSPGGMFTAINFFVKDSHLQCTAFDLDLHEWTRISAFASQLPSPDSNLLKEYIISGSGGLVCVNVSKVPYKEEIMVLNLVTNQARRLPFLHFPRNPVVLHILVDNASNSYKVVAVGSSSPGDAHLSKKIEVFDSQTMRWRVAEDLSGPDYGLNEHQPGVCVDGILYFLTFLDERAGHRGVAAFDVEKGKWVKDRSSSVPFSPQSNILQLVETGGNVYLFSEQEHGTEVEHCIHVLEFGEGGAECELKSVVKVKKSGGRGLLLYPEYACVPFGEGKLCVFNTVKRGGLVYDIQSGMQCEVLEEPPPNHGGENFFSLNPVSFILQPNFLSKP